MNSKHLLVILSLVSLLTACPNSTPADTTPPSISLVASASNITVASNLILTATASDNVGVTRVEFYAGASKLGEDSTPADGFKQTLPLTSSSNGSKSYTAKAFDAAGNNQTSNTVTVTVAIPVAPVDTTGPTLLSSTATSNTSVNLIFSEAIVGGTVTGNFKIFEDLTVTAASVSGDAKTVTLTTGPQTKDTSYAVLVSNVTDVAGNAFDLSNTNPLATSFIGLGP